MEKKINVKLFVIAFVIAVLAAAMMVMPATAIASAEENLTPEQIYGYEDKTVVYDGKSHWIELDESALPKGSVIKFNTIEKEPGIYPAHADIEVDGQVVTVNATLTILATELSDDEGKLIIAGGIDPTVKLSLDNGSCNFGIDKGDNLFANYSVALSKDGTAVVLPNGDYEMRVKVGYGRTGVKAFANEGGTISEKSVTFKDGYVCFKVKQNVTDVAVTYQKEIAVHGESTVSWLWLQIVLGVVVAGEALTIVLQALKLKKM